jgi:hypothetical protein
VQLGAKTVEEHGMTSPERLAPADPGLPPPWRTLAAPFLLGLAAACGASSTGGPSTEPIVATAPVIATQPASVSVTAGERATFRVVAAGTAPLSYAWQRDGTDILSATSDRYTTPATSTADSGARFSVTVCNAKGCATSGAAVLTVLPSTGLFADGFFSIGVFLQGKYDFPKWKSRGVNTIVAEQVWEETPDEPWDHQVRGWTDAAEALGLKVIRRALTNPADDIGNTTLLAWFQGDEPDAAGQGIPNLPEFVARYDAWHAADPTRPIYLNFAGPDVLTAIDGPRPSWCTAATGWCSLTSNYLDYIDHALDWVSNDLYPWAGWLPDNARRGDLTYLVEPIERIRTWTDKPQFCYIETSNQYFVRESPRGVTPDELRAEIWLAIVHGVRGFTYFTGVVPTYGVGVPSDDGTPPDVAAEMTIQNAIVTALAPVLQGTIDPPSLGATVPAPLQACWRDAPSGRYFIVVNPRGTTVTNASITLAGVGGASSASVFEESRSVTLTAGHLTDTFGPFAVHIYVVAR